MAGKLVRRNTRQRRVILEELRKLASHPTATDLYQVIRPCLPRISLATVYRNLELLAADGVIKKLTSTGTQARFDGNPQRHYHVRCVRCGKVDDVSDVSVEVVHRRVRSVHNFKVLDHQLDFLGLCPACRR